MTPRPDLIALPLNEKLNIIEQLWDSLTADEKDPLLIPAWHHDERERRQADFDENPRDALPWAELNCRLVAESVGSGGRQLSARSERPDHREHENQPGR